MPALLRIPLSPPAAGKALAAGEPRTAMAWDALASGDLDAIGFAAASTGDIPSGASEEALREPFGFDEPKADRRFDAPTRLSPTLLLPGSFNPLHEGHRRMLRLAPMIECAGKEDSCDAAGVPGAAPGSPGFEREFAHEAAYELSIRNVDKPPLKAQEAAGRLGHFAADDALWLTRSATFADKARVFPGATFAVGADTIVRIGDLRYYENAAALSEAMHALRECRFLVFGRMTTDRFRTLASLDLPPSLRRLCQGIGAEAFRIDLSSSALRAMR